MSIWGRNYWRSSWVCSFGANWSFSRKRNWLKFIFKTKRRTPNNFDQQVAFFAALFACLAKIAKADGRVDEAEIKKIEEIISSKLNLNREHRNFAINIFQKAKDDNVSFEAYASNLYQILSSSPNSLLVFYEMLFELALADGVLHPSEDDLLKKIPRIFNFDENVYTSLYEKFIDKTNDYFKTLEVNENATFNEIKKAYLKKKKRVSSRYPHWQGTSRRVY